MSNGRKLKTKRPGAIQSEVKTDDGNHYDLWKYDNKT